MEVEQLNLWPRIFPTHFHPLFLYVVHTGCLGKPSNLSDYPFPVICISPSTSRLIGCVKHWHPTNLHPRSMPHGRSGANIGADWEIVTDEGASRTKNTPRLCHSNVSDQHCSSWGNRTHEDNWECTKCGNLRHIARVCPTSLCSQHISVRDKFRPLDQPAGGEGAGGDPQWYCSLHHRSLKKGTGKDVRSQNIRPEWRLLVSQISNVVLIPYTYHLPITIYSMDPLHPQRIRYKPMKIKPKISPLDGATNDSIDCRLYH